MEKVEQAGNVREIEVAGFLWLQGGGDMKKVDVAKEYLDNLKSLVSAVRIATNKPSLPFIYGSSRRDEIPDDLADLEPKLIQGRYPAAQWVLKAQFDAQKAIPHSQMVILRDIETHPANVHYNTAGQLDVGRQFAEVFLKGVSQKHAALGGKSGRHVLAMLGALGEAGAHPQKLEEYRRVFGFLDTNEDGQLSTKEFVEEGKYMTRQARQGIFRASDANRDGVVSEQEYVTNRIITDEAKSIMTAMDQDGDGKVAREEFISKSGLSEDLSKAVFQELDTDGNKELLIPEYLRVWGRWARIRDRDN
jgi:Ca2+-binding EF-hand superfamily protein